MKITIEKKKLLLLIVNHLLKFIFSDNPDSQFFSFFQFTSGIFSRQQKSGF